MSGNMKTAASAGRIFDLVVLLTACLSLSFISVTSAASDVDNSPCQPPLHVNNKTVSSVMLHVELDCLNKTATSLVFILTREAPPINSTTGGDIHVSIQTVNVTKDNDTASMLFTKLVAEGNYTAWLNVSLEDDSIVMSQVVEFTLPSVENATIDGSNTTDGKAVNCTPELHVFSTNETAVSLHVNVSSCGNVTGLNYTFSLDLKSDVNKTNAATQTVDNAGPVLFTNLTSNQTYTGWAQVSRGDAVIATSDTLDILVPAPPAPKSNDTGPSLPAKTTTGPTVEANTTAAASVSTANATGTSNATAGPVVSTTNATAGPVDSTNATTVGPTQVPTVTEGPAGNASVTTAAVASTTGKPVSPPHACNCNEVGTVKGTQCNATSGQCECLEGYTGLNCSACAQDTFYKNETLCMPCSKYCSKCSYKADTKTGKKVLKCNECLKGHGGDLCQDCAPTFYKLTNGTCAGCDCNGNEPPNTKPVCLDGSGKCSACGRNTTGDHCELCLDGYSGSGVSHNCSKPAPSLPPVAPSPTKPSKSHRTAIIVGVVCLFVLVIGLVTVLYVRRRKRRRAPFWTIELREDQDTVNFANMMETEYQDLDATDTDELSMSTRLF